MADRVREACEDCFEAHKSDCSGFVHAVGEKLGVVITGQANDIVRALRTGSGWHKLENGAAAATSASAGKLVVAGLRGEEQAHKDANGHVVVVVAGPLAHDKYPTAYWGQLHGVGRKASTINWAWTDADRDRVTYAAHDLS